MVAFRYRLKIEGLMPERALLRLKRAGIPLYKVQKPQKNAILFNVKKKDVQKVFAIYPTLWYNGVANGEGYTPYKVTAMRAVGLARGLEFCLRRTGVLLGGLFFCGLTLFADGLVLGVSVSNPAYEREVRLALAEQGIKPFKLYEEGKEDLVSARLLSLQGIEFCSVKKTGRWVRVELRSSPFQKTTLFREPMRAKHTGELLSLTVLKGTPLKKAGDTVAAGEPLVGNWLEGKEGEQVRVEVIARAQISCAHEGVYAGVTSAEEAFAQAYLELGLNDDAEIVERSISETEGGFWVKISYLVIESVNL